MIRFFAVALLVAVCGGCEPLTPTSARPERVLKQAASGLSTETCIAGTLKHGDKDLDGHLSRQEFLDFCLLAHDSAAAATQRRLDDLLLKDKKVKQDPKFFAERKAELEAELQSYALERVKGLEWAAGRFKRFDVDHDGRLQPPEIGAACDEFRD